MFFVSVFESVSVLDSVFTVFVPPRCCSGLVVRSVCLWDVLCCCVKDDVCELVYSGVWADMIFNVGGETVPISFFEIPSGKRRERGSMVTNSNVDGEVIAKERIIGSCPGTGWG